MTTPMAEAIIAYSIAVGAASSRMNCLSGLAISGLGNVNMVFGFLAFGSYERREMGDQWFVGGRHRIIAQLGRPHPFELLLFPAFDKTFPAPADLERHEKVEVGIAVARKGQRREALLLDDDTQ